MAIEFDWLVKERCRNYDTGCDVSIRREKWQNESKTSITFYNNSYAKITKSGFIACAVHESRLYFKECDKVSGYQLTSFSKDKSRCNFKLKEKYLPVTSIESGNYILQWDAENRLYYIDVLDKIKEEK